MDLVGSSTPSFSKQRLSGSAPERDRAMLDYISSETTLRGVVLSGGDIANVELERLEHFVGELLEIDHVRDVRLASKALGSLPQHFLRPDVLAVLERIATKAGSRGVELSLHTHINHINGVSETVQSASRAVREAGITQIRNQAVLLRDVNDDLVTMLDLCFGLLDNVGITPYYVYMCDMIPNAEHWRTSLADAQELQTAIQGYLPGFGTPRVVCDVPRAGKRGVHEASAYDRVMGISRWRKAFATPLEDGELPERLFDYYDPMHSLPDEGRERWTELLSREGLLAVERT
jgi:lysine 2,3-aminomutase